MSDQAFHVFVSVEDGQKSSDVSDQYDVRRKVRVEISADAENADALEEATARAASIANAQVAILLGKASPATAQEAKRTRRTKAEIEAEKAAAAQTGGNAAGPSDPTDLPQESGSPQTAGSSGGEPTASTTGADPTALEDDGLPQSSSTGTSAEPDPSQDPFTIEPEPQSPAVETAGQLTPISDGDLNSAVQAKNGALGSAEGTKAIRALIADYNPDPSKTFQLREIPADRRAEFLNRLNELK